VIFGYGLMLRVRQSLQKLRSVSGLEFVELRAWENPFFLPEIVPALRWDKHNCLWHIAVGLQRIGSLVPLRKEGTNTGEVVVCDGSDGRLEFTSEKTNGVVGIWLCRRNAD